MVYLDFLDLQAWLLNPKNPKNLNKPLFIWIFWFFWIYKPAWLAECAARLAVGLRVRIRILIHGHTRLQSTIGLRIHVQILIFGHGHHARLESAWCWLWSACVQMSGCVRGHVRERARCLSEW